MKITDDDIQGIDNRAFEAACRAFSKGEPGTVRRLQLHDSTWPYDRLGTSIRAERQALADAINAYLDAS